MRIEKQGIGIRGFLRRNGKVQVALLHFGKQGNQPLFDFPVRGFGKRGRDDDDLYASAPERGDGIFTVIQEVGVHCIEIGGGGVSKWAGRHSPVLCKVTVLIKVGNGSAIIFRFQKRKKYIPKDIFHAEYQCLVLLHVKFSPYRRINKKQHGEIGVAVSVIAIKMVVFGS